MKSTMEVKDSRDNCLSYWFPLIEAAGVPVPKTAIVREPEFRELLRLLDGEPTPVLERLASAIAEAAKPMGWPCFLRTGQGSGKHNWENCCYLGIPASIEPHIVALVEWSESVDFLGLPYDVWAVREMLPTKPLFRCTRYGNFPVVREFRVFVDGGSILYHVPYWPDGAIEEGRPDDPEWAGKLYLANRLREHERVHIETLAAIAGSAVGGKWSVDILETERGWFVTDMAVAERSYGWRE